ncbi:MAG: autotransporter domain-containing protein [Gloeobacteraceae cyanobacterium ES-bin-144]|nr:autotransporter domain-containing protein [Verrucomicrobiales bacterium]
MKPKYSRYLKVALPTLIVIPAIIQLASAGVITPEPSGNVTIAPNTVAADTITASGGTDANPSVTIGNGAILTGDTVIQNAINVTAPGYTIINGGKLSGDLEGIFSNSDDLTVFNLFAPATGGSSITGGTDGIVAGNGFTLVNEGFGTVSGNGINGVGIFSGNETSIFNDSNATISGAQGGILAGDDAEITNAGNIFGNGGIAIDLGNNGFVENSGVIIGDIGISATSSGLTPLGLQVINSGEIRSNSAGVLQDAIVGSAVDDSITLNLGSLITGNIFGGAGNNTLTFNGGITTPGGTGNVVRGDVEGFTTLTKAGSGVAFIGSTADVGSGLNVFADVININGGGLYFNADIAGDTDTFATINANGAAVGGTGIWTADVNILTGGISAGAIPINLDAIPENSVGSVQILGNVVHSPNSFIRVDIIPNSPINDGINSDIIEQTGVGSTYNVTGANIRLSPTSLDKVITPGKYTIIDSDEAIVGFGSLGTIGVQFNPNITSTGVFSPSGSGSDFQDSVLTRNFTTASLGDANTNLELDIAYGFATLPGFTTNQQSLGSALDALALQPGLGDAEQDFIAALALSDIDSVQNTLSAIGPENMFTISNSIINSNYRLHRMAQDRMAASRAGADQNPSTMEPAKYDSKGGMMSPGQTTSMSSSPSNTIWGSISGDRQTYDGSNETIGSDADVGAVTAGYEYRINPYFIIGGLVDASTADLDNADIESIRFAVYGSYGASLGFYSDFLVGYGMHEFDQTSSVLGNDFKSDTDADSLQALLTAGYTMGSAAVKHGPFVGLEYQNLNVDGFNRTGGGLALRVGDYDVNSLRGLIGYRVNARTGAFTPYASIAYAHEFDGDSENVDASIGGIPFAVRGNDLESAVLITAGTGYDITDSLVLDLGYRGEISTDDDGLSSHGGSISLNYSF